uniref:Transcription factor asg4-like isoform x3 n=1 Tax=Tetraselmis sp. GSL018 TaxID=582737 RepID=A0A061RKR3_9CHLO
MDRDDFGGTAGASVPVPGEEEKPQVYEANPLTGKTSPKQTSGLDPSASPSIEQPLNKEEAVKIDADITVEPPLEASGLGTQTCEAGHDPEHADGTPSTPASPKLSGLVAKLAKPKARRRSQEGEQLCLSPTTADGGGSEPVADNVSTVSNSERAGVDIGKAVMEFNCDTLCTSSVNETDANPSPDEVKGGTQNIDEAEAEAPQSGPEQVANSEFQPLVSDRKDDNLPENPPEVPGSLDTPASASTRKRMPSALAIAAAESAEVISRGRGRVRGPKISRCSRAAMSGRGRRGRGNRGRSGSASETFGAELDGNTLEPAAQCQPEADAEREEKPDSADDRMDPETGEDDKGDKAAADGKSRKSYVSTKQREVWSAEEHERFIEAVEKFGRKWKSVAEYVSTRTPVQIRSHAQKYYNKLSREGYQADIPPPRKKKKVGESSGAAERQPKQGQQGLAPPRDGSARELPAGAQDLVEGVSDAEAVGTGSGSGLSPALGSGNLGQQMEAPPGYEHHTIGWRAPGRGRMPLQPQQEMHVPEAFAGPRGAAMPRMGKLNPLHMGVMMQPCEERASCQPESQQDEWYPGGACQGPMGMAYRGMPEAMGMGGFGHASWQQGRQPEGEAVPGRA